MYYDKCPYCGANLDPGEKCDCREESTKKEQPQSARAVLVPQMDDCSSKPRLYYSREAAISQVF